MDDEGLLRSKGLMSCDRELADDTAEVLERRREELLGQTVTEVEVKGPMLVVHFDNGSTVQEHL